MLLYPSTERVGAAQEILVPRAARRVAVLVASTTRGAPTSPTPDARRVGWGRGGWRFVYSTVRMGVATDEP